MSDLRVVALLGAGVVPAHTPILRADDLGALRGDGVFETMHVRDGRPWLLDEHLSRMARSAARMELELPPRPALVELVGQAVEPWPDDVEGSVRLICTRGLEYGPAAPTVYATVSAVPDAVRRVRHEGITVATASLGFPANLRSKAPWLLGGAKTLSYAVNMAAQRWAVTVDAQDVLWVSTDGYALEGPTSTLVWLDGETLCTVPAEETGILPGTTARWLLDHASALDWRTEERMVTPDRLRTSNGAWFTSSVRGLAAIRTLDRTPLPYSSELTTRIRDLLGYA